jgi:CHAD domain-containing protein
MHSESEDSAAEVVLAYLEEQILKLRAAEPGVRDDAEDQVHQMRVACRRLRTALKTFRPLFEEEQTDPIRDELRWLATSLGDARDTEVLHGRLVNELEADGSGDDPARARIDDDLRKHYRTARRRVLRQLDGARYAALLDRLDGLIEAPPFTAAATAPARDELPRLARKTYRAVRRRHDEAEHAAGTGVGTDDRAAALHEVRKAAKRARYAGEALAPGFGKDAVRFAAAFEELQDLLGEHHDSVVTCQRLGEMAVRAHAAGEDAFTLGVLAGREEERAAAVLRRYDSAWDAASGKELRRWLK